MLGKVAGLGLLLALVLSGCAQPSEGPHAARPPGKVFRMNAGTEPPDLDPAHMEDLVSFTVIMPLMKGLTQFDQQMHAIPAIARRWEVSPDGRRYVFYLRPNARWSDGRPVTSHDFLFAWQRALTPATGAPYAFFLFELKNGKAFYEGKIRDFSAVGARAIDDHTLAVQLARPTPFFADLMATPVSFPLRRDMVEKYGDRFVEAGHYITNGAYQLKSWAHEEKITLVPNPYFYERDPARRPGVDAVEILMVNDANTSVVMYENGALDFIETTTSIPSFDVRRLRRLPEAQKKVLHRINYFGFNTRKPPFDNPKVRQAFGYALDRSYYPRLLQSGQRPMTALVTPGLVGYNPGIGLPYNPEKAKKLLAEAGYPGGRGFPPVRLAYMTSYDLQKEAEIAQFLWKKTLNVDVRLENMEWKVFLSRLREDTPDIFRLGWFIDYPDADSYMGLFLSDSGNNHTHWSSPAYDRLVSRAVTTLNPAERQALYDKAQRLLLEQEAVILPFYASEKTWLVKPYVKNLQINALNLINLDRLRMD